MLDTLAPPRVVARRSEIDTFGWEEASPFGLQGLKRDPLRLLKSDRIRSLAYRLAMRGTRQQIQDADFVSHHLNLHPQWMDEYEVVHLIEKSLWINGRSDLVVTLTKNPSQIPDSPPPEILQSLSRAYLLQPQATVWYGVPLFGEETTSDGLPIPLTAQEVRAEHARRIEAAQKHALRYRWLYRAAVGAMQIPPAIAARVKGVCQHVATTIRQARRDARRRQRARMIADFEYLSTGRVCTQIPEHTTLLGRLASTGAAGATSQYTTVPSAMMSAFAVAQFLPTLFIPITVVAADPFLFLELPDEPGKLRHLGHWYWQGTDRGSRVLHVHA